MPLPADTPTAAQLIDQRTAIEKQIADVEIPVLQRAQAALADPTFVASIATLKTILAELGPGQTASMLNSLIGSVTAARQTVSADIQRHQHTQAL